MDTWQIVHTSKFPDLGEPIGTPSVLEIARRQAEAHRWFESQRRGYDAGPAAFAEWVREHWKRFCRWRYVEHLLGCCRYREFEPAKFGVLREHDDWRHDPVMEFVLLQTLWDAREQLDLLYIAPDEFNRPRIVTILDLLNFNSARLGPPECRH